MLYQIQTLYRQMACIMFGCVVSALNLINAEPKNKWFKTFLVYLVFGFGITFTQCYKYTSAHFQRNLVVSNSGYPPFACHKNQ